MNIIFCRTQRFPQAWLCINSALFMCISSQPQVAALIVPYSYAASPLNRTFGCNTAALHIQLMITRMETPANPSLLCSSKSPLTRAMTYTLSSLTSSPPLDTSIPQAPKYNRALHLASSGSSRQSSNNVCLPNIPTFFSCPRDADNKSRMNNPTAVVCHAYYRTHLS